MVGSLLVLAGCILLALLGENSSRIAVTLDLTVVGLGMGTMFQTFVIATQNRVDMSDLGVATAAIQFFRSMGGSLAVAGLGALLTARLASGLDHATHAVFVAIIPMAALIVVLAFLLPEHELRDATPYAARSSRGESRATCSRRSRTSGSSASESAFSQASRQSVTRSVRARACA